MELNEETFERIADETLQAMRRALDASDLEAEVELSMGVLTIEFEDDTKFVINSHRAAKQIWMAAELSAWHFDPHSETGPWKASRSGDELWQTVEGVLSRKSKKTIALTRSIA